MSFLEIESVNATLQHQYIIIGLIGISIGIFTAAIIGAMKALKNKNAELKLTQQQHIARVDGIRKEHADAMDRIRVEMLKKEEERSRQWHESEKETLHVLNGVSMLLDLNNKIEKDESDKILKKLDEIQNKVEKLTQS